MSAVLPVPLRDIAPRLARARDQLLEERAAQRRHTAWLIGRRLELERLVAHRELQLQRAQHIGDGRYIARRAHKLARARAMLAALDRKKAA